MILAEVRDYLIVVGVLLAVALGGLLLRDAFWVLGHRVAARAKASTRFRRILIAAGGVILLAAVTPWVLEQFDAWQCGPERRGYEEVRAHWERHPWVENEGNVFGWYRALWRCRGKDDAAIERDIRDLRHGMRSR